MPFELPNQPWDVGLASHDSTSACLFPYLKSGWSTQVLSSPAPKEAFQRSHKYRLQGSHVTLAYDKRPARLKEARQFSDCPFDGGNVHQNPPANDTAHGLPF